MTSFTQPIPYFSNINYNSKFFNTNNIPISLIYANDNFLNKRAIATSITLSNLFTGTINCTNTTASTNTLNGSVTVAGGLGANSINCNDITTQNITSATNNVTTFKGRLLNTFALSSMSVSLGNSSNLNTTAFGNAALGGGALISSTSGEYNSALGRFALQNLTTGLENTAVGHRALINVTSGNNNTAIGHNAGDNHIGNRCTFLGSNTYTAISTTWNNSTAIGFNASFNASNQIAVGWNDNVRTIGTLTCSGSMNIPRVIIMSPSSTIIGTLVNVHSTTDTPQSFSTFVVGDSNTWGASLRMNYQNSGGSDYAVIDSIHLGTAAKRLFVNSQGGNVGIGVISFNAPQPLTVAGNIQCSGNYMISGNQISTSNLSDVINGTWSMAFLFNGSGGSSGLRTLTYTKIGNIVTMQIPITTATTGTNSDSLTTTDAFGFPTSFSIASGLRPSGTNVWIMGRTLNNNTFPDSAPCMIRLYTNGEIEFNRAGTGSLTYTNSSTCGLGTAICIRYTAA